jgi:hypothetical protein
MSLSTTASLRRVAGAILLTALASTAHARAESPFSAKLSITESVTLTGMPPCFGYGRIQAVGTASQLGKVTVTSTDCINPQGVFNPSEPNSFTFSSIGSTGTTGLVLTAANGDLLFASYSGTLSAQSPRPHRIDGQFIITGGTGRFAGATGGGTLSGAEDISQVTSGHGDVTLTGTIAY